MRATWPPADVRVVGGRRRHNEVQQHRARLRRQRLLARMIEYPGAWQERGWSRRMADEMGVSPATVSRDLAALGFRRPPPRRASRLSRLLGVSGLSRGEEEAACIAILELLEDDPDALDPELRRKVGGAVRELMKRDGAPGK